MIELDVSVDQNDRISAFGQKVKACLLGQSAASIVAHNIVGTTPGELRVVAKIMRAMLKESGPPPGGRWADLALLQPVAGYPARHTSTMLVFDALDDAFKQIEERRGRPFANDPGSAITQVLAGADVQES
jgi:NifU-like protein involved in Fe-S cluster formation